MRSRLIHDDATRTYALVFEPGDEVTGGLLDFAREQHLRAARFTGLGAFSRATLGFFDLDRKDYDEIPVEEQVEVLTLVGNVALYDGEPRIHAHVVLGRRDGSALGGHLLSAYVRPTLEVMLTESPEPLRREIDAATGLPLLAL